MNEKTINEQYAYIRTLLEEKRLKEALMQLESLLWQCPDWDLRTRLEQLQTSYKYMLEYMRQGANDPERWNVYRKLIADTWEIADRSRLLMLDNASSRYYHEVRRTPRPESLSAYTLKKLLHMLESFNDDLAVSGLLSDEKMDEVLKRHEETLKYMFLQTWTNSAWTPEEEEDAQSMLTSELLPVNDLCHFPYITVLASHKVLIDCLFKHFEQWIEKSVCIEDYNRIEIQPQLFPSDNFQQFFKGTASTRQSDDTITQIGHLLFAFVHGFHFNQLRQACMVPVLLYHKMRNNTSHLTTIRQHRIGHRTHQANTAGTINQTDMMIGKQSPESLGCGKVNRIYFSAGSAIYAYGIYLIHLHHYPLLYQGGKITKKFRYSYST